MPLHRPIAGVTICALMSGAAYFAAAAVTQLVVAAELPLDAAAVMRTTTESAPQPSTTATRNVSSVVILTSNPFDSTSAAMRDASGEGAEIEQQRSDEASPCRTAARVVIAAVDDDPRRSMAVLAMGDAAGSKPLVRLGAMVEGRTVARIEGEHVWLREADGSRYCFVSTTAPARATKTSVVPPIAAAPAAGPTLPKGVLEGIQRIDDNHYAIDRTVRDVVFSSPTELMKSLRIAPEMQGGKAIGVRLQTLDGGSLLSHLGLRAGDVVRSINGFDVTSPEKMLEAYGKLQSAPSVEVSIVRGGAPTVIGFEVR